MTGTAVTAGRDETSLYDLPFGDIAPGPRGVVLAALLRTDAPLKGLQVHGLLDHRVIL